MQMRYDIRLQQLSIRLPEVLSNEQDVVKWFKITKQWENKSLLGYLSDKKLLKNGELWTKYVMTLPEFAKRPYGDSYINVEL